MSSWASRFTFAAAVANFIFIMKGKTINHKVSVLRTIVFYTALILALFLNPTLIVAEESGSNAQDDIAASHVLDGKKFIGPTGEKGK